MFSRLDEAEMGPRSEEIPESGVSTAYRHINLANVLGATTGIERIGRKNVIALSTHVLMDEDYAASRVWIGMANT